MITTLAQPLLDRWIFVMVRVGTEFITPYTEANFDRIGKEGGYGPAFSPFLEKVLATLSQPDWPAGSYYPGGWFRALTEAGADSATAEITPENFSRFYLEEVVVETTGKWRVGKKTITGGVLDHFLRNLRFDTQLERYQIHYWLETHYETRYVHHLSPPFRVVQTRLEPGGISLLLNDGSEEPLKAETLRLDSSERLYCAIRDEGLPAQFEDNARWQLLDRSEERENGLFLLDSDGSETPLHLDQAIRFPGGTGS